MDYQEICEQMDSVATHQLVLLDGLAQSLRPRITDDLALDETMTLTHTVMALNNQMLRWAQVLLTGTTAEEAPACEECREAEETGED